MPLPEYFVVIAAAGKSERFGGKNKLLARVLGKPLLSYTIERVRKSFLYSIIPSLVGSSSPSNIRFTNPLK